MKVSHLFTKEFWNTPIVKLSSSDKRLGILVFLLLIYICIAVAGVAAWQLLN